MTDTASRPSRNPVPWAMVVRQTHLYLGMIIAPSILLFAITGGLQIFRLQESHEGYTPPPIIEKLGRLHMYQEYALKPKRAPEPVVTPVETVAPTVVVAAPAEPKPATPLSKLLLQWFFTLVAGGLVASTLLGMWMGAMVSRSKITARWLLLAGVVLPVMMLLV